MYKSFSIRNYRCFKHFNIMPLKHINLITGPNNIGKTSFLEAVWILQGPYHPQIWLRPNTFRGIVLMNINRPAEELFHNFSVDSEINVIGWTSEEIPHSYTLKAISPKFKVSSDSEYPLSTKNQITTSLNESFSLEVGYDDNSEDYPFRSELIFEIKQLGEVLTKFENPPQKRKKLPSSIFTAPTITEDPFVIAERFGKAEIDGHLDIITKSLKMIEPNLKKLSLIVKNRLPTIQGYIGLNRPIPLKYIGEGMNQLFKYMLNISSSPGGVVLIDEFANGIHHSVLPKIWVTIAKLAIDVDCQVIATTHSWECIKAASEAFCGKRLGNEFTFHRFFKTDEDIKSSFYDCNALQGALDHGFDIR